MRYEGKVVVVTGVGREGQVGEYLARAFARAGAVVIAVDRDAAGLGARVAALRGEALAVYGIAADLTDVAETTAMARRVREIGGPALHALVNAAGGFAPSGPVAESDPTGWARQRAINYDTAYLATRALLPALREGRGAVVYFSAAAALAGGKVSGLAAYVAAKSAVLSLSRVVAEEEKEHGVRANALAPTAIRTAANIESMGEGASYVEREEIASVVLFLCSPAAGSISGEVIRLG